MADRNVHVDAGFGRSDAQTFTIGNGADGSLVDPVDLGRNFAFIIVKCADCQFIQASTDLTVQVGYDDADTMCDLYEEDDPSTEWSKGALPTSGTLAFKLGHASMAQRIRFVLSKAASGGNVVFTVYGVDGSIAGV